MTDAGEQSAAEAQAQALRDSESRYRSVVEGSLQGILIHQDATIRYANPALARMFEYDSPDELIGRPLWDTFVMPENRAELQDRTRAILAGESLPPHPGWRARAKSGREIWVSTSASLIDWQGRPAVVSFYLDVTERVRSAEERHRFVALAETSLEFIGMVGLDFTPFYINPAGLRMVGLDSIAEAAQFKVHELCFAEDQAFVTGEFLPRVLRYGRGEVEIRFRNFKTGAAIWMLCNVFSLRDAEGNVVGWATVSRNIHDRKQAEEALMQSQRFLHTIAAASPDVIYVFDLEGRATTFSNRSLLRELGHDELPANAGGVLEVFEEFTAPEDRAQLAGLLDAWRRLKDGELRRAEYRLRHADGKERWFAGRERALARGDDGAVRQLLGTLSDVTERKRAEEEHRKLQAQVQHAQKLESLGVLAGGIAHDFNNLLTGILGYADLALVGLAAGMPRNHIEQVVKGAQQAAELTQQLLAYSGKGRFVVQPVSLSALVQDMHRLLEISISKKCVLKYNLQPELPAIDADAVQMRQIVMNLVINASEAIAEQSGVISVGTGLMHCDRAYLAGTYLDEQLAEGVYAFLEVADTGSGMSAETRARIFDPFFTTKFTGRGLGLAAVLGIVRGHKGALKVYSEPGRGSTFKVLFRPAQQPAVSAAAAPELQPLWRGSGVVLVVDDEETVRTMARHMLQAIGFTVLTAADGREGVDVFRSEAERIRLVLLDVTMPQLGGEETYREIRRIRADVPTILSSGYNEQSAMSSFAGKGLAGFIQKPYRFEALLAAVQKALEARAR